MAKKNKHQVPGKASHDKTEDERKYRVNVDKGVPGSLEERSLILEEVFNFVASEQKHFKTLDCAPHTDGIDAELQAVIKRPHNIKPVRTRYHWDTIELAGSSSDEGRVEVRTEQKIGKDFYEQVLKIGGCDSNGDGTLRRQEHPCELNAPGTNINLYEPSVARAAYAILGHKPLYPLVRIQSQSTPILYHPDGYKDILFEIKFDVGIVTAFDGYQQQIAEVEIEPKEYPEGIDPKVIAKLLKRSERALKKVFGAHLELIGQTKVSSVFDHLVMVRHEDKKAFKRAAKESRFIAEVYNLS